MALGDCPAYEDLAVEREQAATLWVAGQMSRCSHDSVATGLYGGLLLRDGQVGASLIWLEKSLLLDPDQPGVAADYALALAAIGETDASSALAQQVLNRNDVPGDLETLLDDLIRRSAWEYGFQVVVGAGVSNNIAFEPDLDSLELTFGDDGRALIPLADPSSAQTQTFDQQSAQWTGRYSRGDIVVTPRLGVSARSAGEIETAEYRSVAYDVWLRKGATALGVGGSDVSFATDQDRREWFVGVDRTLAVQSPCALAVGARYEQIDNVQDLYDARTWTVVADALCPNGWELQAALGWDFARNDRAGGDKRTMAIAAAQTWALSEGSLRLSGDLVRESDADKYSEFLARGAPRVVDTLRLGASWEWPLTARWSVLSQISHVNQMSNMSLFDVTGSEISISVIYKR